MRTSERGFRHDLHCTTAAYGRATHRRRGACLEIYRIHALRVARRVHVCQVAANSSSSYDAPLRACGYSEPIPLNPRFACPPKRVIIKAACQRHMLRDWHQRPRPSPGGSSELLRSKGMYVVVAERGSRVLTRVSACGIVGIVRRTARGRPATRRTCAEENSDAGEAVCREPVLEHWRR